MILKQAQPKAHKNYDALYLAFYRWPILALINLVHVLVTAALKRFKNKVPWGDVEEEANLEYCEAD